MYLEDGKSLEMNELDNTYRASIIGCGKIAGSLDDQQSINISSHASAYHKHKKFNLTSICDHSSVNLKKFSRKWGVVNTYKNLVEMLEVEKPHILSICTPTEYHYDHLMQTIKSKWIPKVILLEKPCCNTKNEYLEMINQLKNIDCEVFINHIRRFCNGHNQLKKIIESKKLGNLLSGSIYYYGDWMNNGCHIIDTLFMLFNEKIELKSVLKKDFNDNDKLFLDLTLLINKSEIEIKVYDEANFQIYESDFFFEKGRVKILDFGSKILVQKVVINNWEEKILSEISGSPIKGLDSTFYVALEKIVKFLNGDTVPELLGTSLINIEPTMNILWESREKIK